MRKKKLKFQDIINDKLLEYFNFTTLEEKNTGIIYTALTLCKSLTDEQQNEYLKQYNNIKFTNCSYRYAPEIQHTVLLLKK